MIDDPGIFQPYFPAALRGLPRGYSRLVHRVGRPSCAMSRLATAMGSPGRLAASKADGRQDLQLGGVSGHQHRGIDEPERVH